MLIRIVKMSFHPEKINEFLQLYEERKEQIQSSDGCIHLELMRDVINPSTLFTYSHWDSAEYLEKYRRSEFFKDTWQKTRSFFNDKAEAWSLRKI